MSKTVAIFHFVVLVHHSITFYQMSLLDYKRLPEGRSREMMKMGSRYFTSWNMAIQGIYILVAFLLDMHNKLGLGMPKLRSKVVKFNGCLFNVFVFPSTIFVSICFWTLYSIEPEWVLPKEVQSISSFWLNHAIHTNIVLVVLGELLLTSGDIPRPKFKTALILLNIFIFIYNAQFIYTYYQTGIWMYAIFYELTWSLRALLLGISAVSMLALLKIVYMLHVYKTQNKRVGNVLIKYLNAATKTD